jgi:hypothetical protein
MRVQLQQRRKSDGMGDGIEESRQRKHSPFQYFERAIDERVGMRVTASKNFPHYFNGL